MSPLTCFSVLLPSSGELGRHNRNPWDPPTTEPLPLSLSDGQLTNDASFRLTISYRPAFDNFFNAYNFMLLLICGIGANLCIFMSHNSKEANIIDRGDPGKTGPFIIFQAGIQGTLLGYVNLKPVLHLTSVRRCYSDCPKFSLLIFI